MDGRILRRRGVAALAALFLSATPTLAGWPFGGPQYTSRYDIPPSAYGYRLDERGPTYYGGANYIENYRTEFWGSLGWAAYPGPIGPGGLPLVRNRHPQPEYPLPPIYYTPTAHLFPEVRFTIHCPDDAEVLVEGQKMQQSGCERTFVSPPLEPGEDYEYTIRARWKDGERAIEQEKKVIVHAGAAFIVRFPLAAPMLMQPPEPIQAPQD
jgi:uncharacterized protein (TIGR03000 family)